LPVPHPDVEASLSRGELPVHPDLAVSLPRGERLDAEYVRQERARVEAGGDRLGGVRLDAYEDSRDALADAGRRLVDEEPHQRAMHLALAHAYFMEFVRVAEELGDPHLITRAHSLRAKTQAMLDAAEVAESTRERASTTVRSVERRVSHKWGPIIALERRRSHAVLPVVPLGAAPVPRPRERRDSGRRGSTRAGPDDDSGESEPPGGATGRLCECGCRRDITHKRAHARTFDATCRKRLERRRKAEPNPDLAGAAAGCVCERPLVMRDDDDLVCCRCGRLAAPPGSPVDWRSELERCLVAAV
jgi:hypothetical protein